MCICFIIVIIIPISKSKLFGFECVELSFKYGVPNGFPQVNRKLYQIVSGKGASQSYILMLFHMQHLKLDIYQMQANICLTLFNISVQCFKSKYKGFPYSIFQQLQTPLSSSLQMCYASQSNQVNAWITSLYSVTQFVRVLFYHFRNMFLSNFCVHFHKRKKHINLNEIFTSIQKYVTVIFWTRIFLTGCVRVYSSAFVYRLFSEVALQYKPCRCEMLNTCKPEQQQHIFTCNTYLIMYVFFPK